MYIFVLLAFMIVFSIPSVESQRIPPRIIAAGVAGYLLVVALLGLLDRWYSQENGDSVNNLRHRRFSSIKRMWLLGGVAGMIILGLRELIISSLGLEFFPMAGALLAIVPFFLGLYLMWYLDYPFHVQFRRNLNRELPDEDQVALPEWNLSQYLGYNTRHHILFVAVPVCLIVGLTEVSTLYLLPMVDSEWQDVVQMLISFGIAGTIFLTIPVVIVHVWKTAPLEEGKLRNELEEMCRKMNIRFREILVWKSGGVLANAGAMGILPRFRYLLISDAVLERMSPLEIRAVFAHEMGHIRGRHIPFMCLFALSTIFISMTAGLAIAILSSDVLPEESSIIASLAVMILLWALAFGHISKRFERHSDVFGAWAAGTRSPDMDEERIIRPEGAEAFTHALEDVTALNGVGLYHRNWRHGRTSERISYIRQLAARGGTLDEEDRAVNRIKKMIWVAAAAGAAAITLFAYLAPAV